MIKLSKILQKPLIFRGIPLLIPRLVAPNVIITMMSHVLAVATPLVPEPCSRWQGPSKLLLTAFSSLPAVQISPHLSNVVLLSIFSRRMVIYLTISRLLQSDSSLTRLWLQILICLSRRRALTLSSFSSRLVITNHYGFIVIYTLCMHLNISHLIMADNTVIVLPLFLYLLITNS